MQNFNKRIYIKRKSRNFHNCDYGFPRFLDYKVRIFSIFKSEFENLTILSVKKLLSLQIAILYLVKIMLGELGRAL